MEERWAGLGVALAVLAAVLLVTRPWLGILHDAQLYLFQALALLEPERLADDLFLKFGSQDRFTLFSRLYAPVLALLGPQGAQLAMMATGLTLWALAMLALSVSLFGRGAEALIGAAAALVATGYYGSGGIFQYAEPFATPRLFAEAAVLLALALRRRPLLAGIILLAALLIHPLMALPGMAVLGVYLGQRRRWPWFAAGIGLLCVMVLAVVGVEPFDRLLVTFDAEWFAVSYNVSRFCFLTRWTLLDFAGLASMLVVLTAAARVEGGDRARLLRAAAAVAIGGTVVTWLGADLTRNALLASLQTWRAAWIGKLLANVLLAVIAARGLARRDLVPVNALILVVLVLERWLQVRSLVTPLALFGVAALWWRPAPPDGGRRATLAFGLLCLAVAALAVVAAEPLAARVAAVGVAALAVQAAVLAAGLVALSLRPRAPPAGLVIGTALGLGAAGLATADARAAWQRYVTDPTPDPALVAFLAGTRTVYWPQGMLALWFKQRRPSYYSALQGAGVMFHAATAREHSRRAQALLDLNTIDAVDDDRRPQPPPGRLAGQGPGDAAPLRAACADLPDLDAVVLETLLPDLPHRSWRTPVPLPPEPNVRTEPAVVTFHLYPCAPLREQASVAGDGTIGRPAQGR